VLLTSQDAVSAETQQAVETLERLGPSVIPKLIEALSKVRNPQTIVALLVSLLQNATLPLFGEGLASSNPRVIAGVVEALTQATTYDPNRLLEFCTNPRIAGVTLEKLLTARKETLRPEPLLRYLDTARPEDRPLLLGLVRHVATVAVVPALIRHTASADETVRLAMIHTLARFSTEEVRGALMGLLADPHGSIREAALAGLANLQLPLELGAICQLLRDPEGAVRRQATLLLTQRKDPQIVPSLFEVLQDPSAEIHQGAVELLLVVGDASSLKAAVTARADTTAVRHTLMRLLAVPQTRVRQLALEGLASLASLEVPLDVAALCRLLWDPDPTIREQVTVLLAQLNDLQTLPTLLETLQDEVPDVLLGTVVKNLLSVIREKEWWVTVRVTDALGRSGGAKLVRAVLQLSRDPDADLRHDAIEILKLSQDPQILDFLVDALDSQEPWATTCAAEAIVALHDRRAVPALLHLAHTDNADMGRLALRTLTALEDARAIPACLTHLQEGTPALRQEALQALATLTDAEHSEAVLQAVMAVRNVNDTDLKAQANSTASTLIRRFGDRAIGRSTSLSGSMTRPSPQSLLHESTIDSRLRETVVSTPGARGSVPETAALDSRLRETVVSTPGARGSVPETAPAAPGSEPMLDAATLEPNMVVAERYRIVRRIGQGGFGTVVLAEDMMVQEQLILKFLNPQMAADAEMIQRFIHELRYARRVTHENVIRIHDFLYIEKAYAISMEYFPSHDLSADIATQAPLPIPRGLRILWYICRGMHAAHQVKIIHRDLKPANVLIDDIGMVKIVDFGLAAAVSDSATRLTKTGAMLGTPLYMAPEQIQNSTIDTRTDIYSLGVMMYEMFTGRPPYLGDNPMAILYQHMEGKATPPHELNPQLPLALEAMIQKAMAVDPEQRFQSIEELGKSLILLFKQSVR